MTRTHNNVKPHSGSRRVQRTIASLSILLLGMLQAPSVSAAGPTHGMWKRGQQDNDETAQVTQRTHQEIKLAGLNVAIWQPELQHQPMPLVVFSHGFRGGNRSYTFLSKSFADAGYIVIAPNHSDSLRNGIVKKQVSFSRINDWSEQTYKDREVDIKKLLDALQTSAEWNTRIDWSKIALVGHSLGGYTMLGMAGAWPSWKMPGIKAVIALAPYTNPFLHCKTLANISVPVMYQSGTRDFWIDSFIKGRKGAYSQTPSPAVFVELNASHFAWTDLSSNKKQKELISHYCLEFLDKYVREKITAHPEQQLEGVILLETK